MTSFTATKRHRRRGFTLIELLVTLGIILIVIGLLLPALLIARKKAAKTRIAADLQVISQGLEAYRQDFKDYPRIDYSASNPIITNTVTTPAMTDRLGAITLCWALLAPGPDIGPGNVVGGNGSDGAPGPGFRVRGTVPPQGQIWGPYIPPGRFQVSGTMDWDSTINDTYGHPYLYFPAYKGAIVNVTQSPNNGGYVSAFWPSSGTPPTPLTAGTTVESMYNYNDNTMGLSAAPLKIGDMEQILGDTNQDGAINANNTTNETASAQLPYLLWSGGADELYGLDPSTGKTDDVTNFDIPANLQK
jgi:prepilin-type N-terminal cleavage/methylation domain-containing protein